ncbi:hypothetical protein KOW79_009756 [Hemibagrus wyckioides]|uniref:Uncharacterized protein n=1 Tax=Hemibagrus wyckioides TaxID=337641 RepID=A0A9D3NSM1_9TELE|nr:hypothetical protein KOW79_009756 [Hemibagrus wyckioides]
MLAGEVNRAKQKAEIRSTEEWKSILRNGMYTVKDVVKLWQNFFGTVKNIRCCASDGKWHRQKMCNEC